MGLKPPCEMMVRTYLPLIRRSLAQKLVDNGVSQSEAADRLGLTQAAVSQYLSRKRGSNELEELGLLEKLTEEFASTLAEEKVGEEDRVLGLCGICVELRSSKTVCEPHLGDGELVDCKICCA
ncbi:MAG: hypothetical protein MAG715_01183 [Methanonatronarchaeales archaeon]|nr:hypothetical protein [Methanonatronarchaeales archaeon]